VRKTTIYLPDELKKRVERTARRQQRSEAEVIRAAIEQFTNAEPPRPTLPLFKSGAVVPIDDWDDALRGFGED
jgi:metal-responsive CopG/Arc/MetJ family transcriptional regulator